MLQDSIKSIMTSRVISVLPDTPISVAIDIILSNNFNGSCFGIHVYRDIEKSFDTFLSSAAKRFFNCSDDDLSFDALFSFEVLKNG